MADVRNKLNAMGIPSTPQTVDPRWGNGAAKWTRGDPYQRALQAADVGKHFVAGAGILDSWDSFEAGKENFGQGNYLRGVGNYAAGAFDAIPELLALIPAATGVGLPLAAGMAAIPPVGPMVRGLDKARDTSKALSSKIDDIQGIKAYHGSPHDFDEFKMDKIGTGEGAQAYGHGLYFAENEGVARGYKNALSDQNANLGSFKTKNGDEISAIDAPDGFYSLLGEYPDNTSYEQILKSAEEKLQWAQTRKGPMRDVLSKKAQDVVDFVKSNDGVKFERNPDRGRMYEVNINANPDDFLDYDKPLSEQSESVQSILSDEPFSSALKSKERWREEMLRGRQASKYAPPIDDFDRLRQPTGEDLLRSNLATEHGEDFEKYLAERKLKEAGIPGIKYKDAGSRGLDGNTGTSNYVVFDEKLISIIKKYGIAGAIGMGLISQEQGEAYAAQEGAPMKDQIDQLMVAP